jgi:hypothetical protein
MTHAIGAADVQDERGQDDEGIVCAPVVPA